MGKLTSAQDIAITTTKADYIEGDITIDQLEHRIATILGAHGIEARDAALAPTEYIDITSFGSPVPQLLAYRWVWPD